MPSLTWFGILVSVFFFKCSRVKNKPSLPRFEVYSNPEIPRDHDEPMIAQCYIYIQCLCLTSENLTAKGKFSCDKTHFAISDHK